MSKAKKNHFNSGDLVSGKKWNGEHFIGIYEHEYDCGDHSIFDGEKHFCIHKKDCHLANEEEVKEIKETILKKIKIPKKTKKKEEEISEDELEEMLTEETLAQA